MTTPPHDERWALFVGLLAIAAFAVAGLARLSVGLSTAVYLVIVLASLTSFALAVAHIRTTSS